MPDRVKVVTDLRWPFVDGTINAYASIPADDVDGVRFGHDRSIYVDPFPGYHHDVAVVEATLAAVEERFALPAPVSPKVSLLDREVLSRVNAMVWANANYGDEKPPPFVGHILMSGKRIPPHPAVTRYLVGHEYGHVVEEFLGLVAGQGHGRDDFISEYTAIRYDTPGKPLHATGGRWHESTAEVFACDFRILVARIEVDFWPHPGIRRPEDSPGLAEWWADQLELAGKYVPAEPLRHDPSPSEPVSGTDTDPSGIAEQQGRGRTPEEATPVANDD